jgi:hypothetical protein
LPIKYYNLIIFITKSIFLKIGWSIALVAGLRSRMDHQQLVHLNCQLPQTLSAACTTAFWKDIWIGAKSNGLNISEATVKTRRRRHYQETKANVRANVNLEAIS